jgi:hypothetical protein
VGRGALAAHLRALSYWGFVSLGAPGTDDLIALWRRFERAEAEADTEAMALAGPMGRPAPLLRVVPRGPQVDE